MIELVGLLPAKILLLTRASFLACSGPSSSMTCSSVFPKARALDAVGQSGQSSSGSFVPCKTRPHLLGLGKEVGQQDAVVVSDLVLGLDGGQEITARGGRQPDQSMPIRV